MAESLVRCYADETTSGDWVVEQDGIKVARFSALRYGRNAVYYAARDAKRRTGVRP